MRKILQKNEVSIMKLSARRGLECRILHHLSQNLGRKGRSASICLLLFNFLLLLQNLLTSPKVNTFHFFRSHCSTVWICKIFFVFSNMIQDFLYLCLYHIMSLIEVHTHISDDRQLCKDTKI
jgi:hypothetical protein